MTNISKEKQMLINHVRSIVNTLENGISIEVAKEDYGLDVDNGELPDGFWYLQHALDIEYIVSRDKETALGARVLVAFGGPNIWINTRTKTVEGYWCDDSYTASYFNDEFDLDDAIETLWSC